MTKAENYGSVCVWQDGDIFTLFTYDQKELIEKAVTSGQAWYSGKDMHGSDITIKIARVIKVDACTPKQWAEREIEKKEDAILNGE
jgi:hypothetical protein